MRPVGIAPAAALVVGLAFSVGVRVALNGSSVMSAMAAGSVFARPRAHFSPKWPRQIARNGHPDRGFGHPSEAGPAADAGRQLIP